MSKSRIILTFLVMLFIFSLLHITQKTPSHSTLRNWNEIKKSGKLEVLTLYSSTSYFIYQSDEMGYEYELIRNFARSQGLQTEVKVAPNFAELKNMLHRGEGDIIAYPVPYSLNNQDSLVYCGHKNITCQVLIQRNDEKIIQDVTDLIGKEIYVEKDSKFEKRLINLNQELGGGILIHTISEDSLNTEDLIRMVANREIDYTTADDNVARVNKTFHSNLNIQLQISFSQSSSWAVRSENDSLAYEINQWISSEIKTPEYASLSKRYFEKSKFPKTPIVYLLSDGRLSIYDALFKKYANKLGWDWRLLAALSFEESRFDPYATSWAGARGLMQLMPNTGYSFGLKEKTFNEPEENISAGVNYIHSLQRGLMRIKDPEQRIRFVLASFHSGLGHIYDAIELANKHGYDTQKWDNNVALCLELKSDPEFYNDTIVRHGYFPGQTTIDHVNEILECYNDFKKRVKE